MVPAIGPAIPYEIIANCFRNHSVVPFLGSAASFVGAPKEASLLSGSGFAEALAKHSGYPGPLSDPLTKVAQYLEEIPADRDYLLSTIYAQFFEGVASEYRSSMTEFLTRIPASLIPKLIITTNYDVLVERTLESRGVPYLALSHIMKGSKFAGRLLCYDTLKRPLDLSNIQPLKNVEAQLLESESTGVPPVLIYKMHGTARLCCNGALVDSVVLTENDYIDFFAQDLLNRIPNKILALLRASRLLFLGYALEDWNFRVLLRKLQLFQGQERHQAQRHWACLLSAGEVEVKFWDRRGVNLYQQSLDVFLTSLSEEMR